MRKQEFEPLKYTFFTKARIKKFLEIELKKTEPVFIESENIDDMFIMKLFYLKKEFPNDVVIAIKEHHPKRNMPNVVIIGIEINDLFFDKELKKAMCHWVTGFVLSGKTAMSGIRSFLEYYDISEDDYGELTAHRAWMRYYHREYEKLRPSRKANTILGELSDSTCCEAS